MKKETGRRQNNSPVSREWRPGVMVKTIVSLVGRRLNVFFVDSGLSAFTEYNSAI